MASFGKRQKSKSFAVSPAGHSHNAKPLNRRATSTSLELTLQAQARMRPKTSTSVRLATRNADAALQCWVLPTSEGGAGGTVANLLERAASTISLTGVAEEGADGDFLRRVLKSGQLTGLHKACAQGNINAVVSIVKIDSERQGQLGYAGLSERDVFGRTPLMYAAVADSKPCLDMLLTCGAKREVRDPNGHTAVHYAAYFGQHRALKFLIEAACDWAPHDIYGRPPLHISISSDSVKCLQLLLKHCSVVGGDVDLVDKEAMTALHVAAHCGKAQHLSTLLKAGASPKAVDMEGKTAMHWAVTNTDATCITTLHQAYPAIVNMRDIYSETVLHVASKLGYAHIVDAVCSMENCNMDTKCRDDQSALHLATIHCQNSCVSTLLRHGALDACVDSFGLSPLHYAIMSGSVDVVRLYAQLESLANLPDSDGRRPLHWAVTEDNAEMLALLLEHPDMQADVNIEDKRGMTAAHLAVENGSTDCLSELLNANATVNKRSSEVESPVFVACETGKAQCLELIMRSGCNPNLGSFEGLPCLHAIILGQHTASLKVLLSYSADANVYDAEGTSALQAAAFSGYQAAVTELLLNGARPDDQGSSGLTPLHLASGSGHDEVVEALLQRGAAVNVRSFAEEDITALDAAKQNGHDGCAAILQQCGGMTMEEIQSKAATIIQAVSRGYLARRSMLWLVERRLAVVAIQKTVRGFLQRRRFQSMLQRRNAAVTIQSYWRGHLERCSYRTKLTEYNQQAYHQRLIHTLHDQLTQKWRQEGLTRTPPKAQPPVQTRKQLQKNPPQPILPPAYDLEPVKSVTKMLEEESTEERQERIAMERRKRLEMALAMREQHATKVKQVQHFHEQEKQRIRQKELAKQREHYSGIVQASVQRHRHGRALMHHSHTVRSTVTAAIAVQRCFRVWRDKIRQKPLVEREQKQRLHTEQHAAEAIQSTWRHYQSMKKVKEAKQLLNQYRVESLMRGTEAEMNVARYQQPTLQKRFQSRKLLTSPPPPPATGKTSSQPPKLGEQASRKSFSLPSAPGTGRTMRHSTSLAAPSTFKPPRTLQSQPKSMRTSRAVSVNAPPARQPDNDELLDLMSSLPKRSMSSRNVQSSNPLQRRDSKPHGGSQDSASEVAAPLSKTKHRRWSIPSRPVLPRIADL
eukprot:scpid22323/ scgid0979/ Inversin